MSVLSRVFEIPVKRNTNIVNLQGGLLGIPALFGSKPATLATQLTALTLPAFYNAIDLLSDDIAKLPKHVFQKEGNNRTKAKDHYLNYLLNVRPNAKMTPFVFWKTIETLRLLKGNAFVQKVYNQNTGRIESLHIRDNAKVQVLEDQDQLWYKYNGQMYSSQDFLHFIGFTLDGKVGCGVVTYAASQLGVSLEAQYYGQTIYKNRGLSYGVIETDKAVEDTNKKLISDAFTAKLNSGDVHRAPVLDEGLKYKSITITPQEAQFLEASQEGVIQICRWLNIAPHKLKDLTKANYSNIYQQSIEHVQDSVLPRVIAKEEEMNYKFFSAKELETFYIKMNVASLLRGDMDAKAKFYTSMVYAGIYTRNEVRELEDKNPIVGLEEPLQPVNMQALSIAMKLTQEQNGTN